MLVKYSVIKKALRQEGQNLHWEVTFPDYPDLGGFGGTAVLPLTPAEFKVAIEAALVPFLQDYRSSLQMQTIFTTILDNIYEVDVP